MVCLLWIGKRAVACWLVLSAVILVVLGLSQVVT